MIGYPRPLCCVMRRLNNYVIQCMRVRLGVIAKQVPWVCVPFLHTCYKYTSLIRKLSGINGGLNLINLRRKNRSLIRRSSWNLNAKWATSCQQNARQILDKIQTIQEVLLQILKSNAMYEKNTTFPKYWWWMTVPGDLNTGTKPY